MRQDISSFTTTKKLIFGSAVFALSLLCAEWSQAAGSPNSWKDHARPFNYLFGNHIDTHQQTKQLPNGQLQGFFYIIYLDEDGDGLIDIDPVSGLPLATHPRESLGEICGETVDCVAGWTMRGIKGNAKFLFHNGVNAGEDHPVWMVNRTDETIDGSFVSGIPQPGSYTHFHWISEGTTDLRADEVSEACNKIDAADLENQEPTAVNQICQGWFLEIMAVANFAFEHGGEVIPVHVGTDNRTHLNIVTDYKEVPGITSTR